MRLDRTPDLQQTRDHWWWRPGWSSGRRFLTFHLTFEAAPELATATAWTTRLAEVPGVHVVPARWFHLTLTGLGFADEINPDAAELLAENVFVAAQHLAVEPLRLERLRLSPEALFLVARTDPWVVQLDEVLRRAIGPEDGTSSAEFRPHVSVAYFGGPVNLDALETIVRLGHPEPVVVARPSLSLIELGRDDQLYTWRVIAQRLLG